MGQITTWAARCLVARAGDCGMVGSRGAPGGRGGIGAASSMCRGTGCALKGWGAGAGSGIAAADGWWLWHTARSSVASLKGWGWVGGRLPVLGRPTSPQLCSTLSLQGAGVSWVFCVL